MVEERSEIMQRIVIKSYESKKSLVSPIVFLLLGLLLFLNPGNVVEFVSYIFGGVFLALGISKMLADFKRMDRTTGDMFYSIMMVVLGIIFIFFSGTIEFIIRLSIGVWIIINALNTIAIGANLMRVDRNSIVSLIIGFILLLIGLYTIFVSNLILSTLGLVLVIYASLSIGGFFFVQAKKR